MLTRPRRQVLATLALVGFTIVPSLYVAYSAHRVRRPDHLREVEAEVGRRLGVLVKVTRASHPRPDVDQLEGVALRLDDARNSEIARADSLRVTRGSGEMTLKVGRLGLKGVGGTDVLANVVTLMRRLISTEVGRIALVADRAEIDLGGRVETVRDLAAILQVDREAPTLTASYLVADESGKTRTRCELVLRREVQPAGVKTTLAFKTMDGAIPSRLLSPFFDAEGWLGDSATVEGTLNLAHRDGSDWEADFAGSLGHVDLDSVVGRRFAGHRLEGRARVTFEAARWAERAGGQGSGWVEARGVLASGPGSISVPLLRALEDRMRFRLDGAIDPRRADVEFQGLGLSFAMNELGELRLGGAMGLEFPPDVVLVQRQGARSLARAPQGVANVRGLWNTLIPAAEESLAPVVPEAHALQSLPLPPGRATPLSAN